MVGFSRIFVKRGCPNDVIPLDSPWYLRWGMQGLKAILRYRELTSGKFDHLKDEQIGDLAQASDAYAGAQFACQYGREGNRRFREYVRYLENERVASRDELSRIIRAGELRVRKRDGAIVIRPSWLAAACGITFLGVNLLALTSLSFEILSATAPLIGKLVALLVVALFFGYNMWEFNQLTLKPHLIAKRRGPELSRILGMFVNRSGPKSA